MRHELSNGDREIIKNGVESYQEHLRKILNTSIEQDAGLFAKFVVGKSYSLGELSDFFDWPLKEGFTKFIHDSKLAHSPAANYLSRNNVRLVSTPQNLYKIVKLELNEAE